MSVPELMLDSDILSHYMGIQIILCSVSDVV